MATKLLLLFAICRLISIVGLTLNPTNLFHVEITGHLTTNHDDIKSASTDFGKLTTSSPIAILNPSSTSDISNLIKLAYESPHGFTISARGHGHSINGQSQTSTGVIVQMSDHKFLKSSLTVVSVKNMFVDVWGGELWIDVLKETLKHGLSPKSWTDYLYLSVGGTLSNGGISGQAFNHGPQISNVYEMDVVTGTL